MANTLNEFFTAIRRNEARLIYVVNDNCIRCKNDGLRRGVPGCFFRPFKLDNVSIKVIGGRLFEAEPALRGWNPGLACGCPELSCFFRV